MNNESIFHEIYGVYYQAIAEIINKVIDAPLSETEIRETISKYAFRESPYLLMNAIQNNRYYTVIHKNDKTGKYETSIKNKTQLPLSLLEKRWLKTISEDPRVKLFDCKFPDLENVEPLYERNDIYFCGQYCLGDDYSSERYIANFKKVFKATKEKNFIYIKYLSPKDGIIEDVFEPYSLQYSTKENRFRLFAFPRGTDVLFTINLARITECEPKDKITISTEPKELTSYVEVRLKNERQTLERFLLYFSNFERRTSKLDNGEFSVKVIFPQTDETEVLVNILAFTPMVKIIAPEYMKEKFLQRIQHQKELFYDRTK